MDDEEHCLCKGFVAEGSGATFELVDQDDQAERWRD